MICHRSLSDSKSMQVPRTLLSILANLDNAVDCIVPTYPLISKSTSPSTNPLVTERTNYNWYYRHLHVPYFFQFSNNVQLFISLFDFLQFYPVVSRNSKIHFSAGSLFICWLSLGLVVWQRFDDSFVSKNPREFCAFHFPGRILGCAYTICLYGQIWTCTITCGSPYPPPQLSLVLYSLCANLKHWPNYVIYRFVSLAT